MIATAIDSEAKNQTHTEDRVVVLAGNSHGCAAETHRIQVEVF